MNKIYISGKITGIEKEAPAIFEKAEKELQAQGFETVNPMKLPHNHDKTYKSYMRECVKALCDCDSIYMLTNWKNSDGAKTEFDVAGKLWIKIIFEPTQP